MRVWEEVTEVVVRREELGELGGYCSLSSKVPLSSRGREVLERELSFDKVGGRYVEVINHLP